MKKIILAAALGLIPVFSFAAATGTGCAGGPAGLGTELTVEEPAEGEEAVNEFIKRGFTPQCSANVILGYAQTATALAVSSASSKGKTIFVGSSEGGAVTRDSDCEGDCSTSPDTYTGIAETKLGVTDEGASGG